MLEDNVDEKYYLSDKMKQYIFSENNKYKVNQNSLKLNRDIACSKTTREGWTRADTSDYIVETCIEKKPKKIGGLYENSQAGSIYSEDAMCPTLTTESSANWNILLGLKDKPKVLGGVGEKKSNSGTQWYQQDRIYNDNVAISITTECNPYYKNNLRIRKLTPKECFRLMGVKDEDFDKVKVNQSDSSLYHLAGDSIVVNVLMAIFKEML
jgi:DNA (cytosine-5)-methyltransferase 1